MKLRNLILLASMTLPSIVFGAGYSTDVRQALQTAVEDAGTSLSQAIVDRKQTISVLPIQGDQGRYVEGLIKNAVTNSGLVYVEGRNDPFWDEIMAEVEWDERKDDMLDPSTIDKFGKLKSTQWLIYGTVRAAEETGRSVYVEIELHLSSIETKQHLWGDMIARRYYKPGEVTGIVDLDIEVRNLLRKAVSKQSARLNGSEKLSNVSRVVIAPVAGDIDGYIGSVVEDMISATTLIPVRLDANTLGEVRQIIRDRPNVADAVMTGAVRELSRELKFEEPLKDIYEINAEVQLRIESAVDGSVLWSQTVATTGEDVVEKNVYGVAKENKKWLLYIGAGVVGLILLMMFFAASRRSR